jgi:hypothetical protein
MAKKRKQAYKQAPWRRQLRSLGLSLLPVIAIAIVTALHLAISARSAAAGLQIMEMHYDEEEILRQIANQRTDLAWVTSYQEMQKRAKKLDYSEVSRENLHYLPIPGYKGKSGALIAPPPGSEPKRVPLINDFYQESLWDWIAGTFLKESAAKVGLQ